MSCTLQFPGPAVLLLSAMIVFSSRTREIAVLSETAA
jgi:hypothetical protein